MQETPWYWLNLCSKQQGPKLTEPRRSSNLGLKIPVALEITEKTISDENRKKEGKMELKDIPALIQLFSYLNDTGEGT